MGIQDYGQLTEAQKLRDGRVVERVRDLLVTPLLDELESAVPGYRHLCDKDKYLALLRLNETNAPIGEWMLVDFGVVGGWNTCCAFYSGDVVLTGYSEHDGAKAYHPWVVQSDYPGLPRTPGAFIMNNLMLNVEAGSGEFLEAYSRFPVCFKLAYAAEALRQNILISRSDACRFVAGFDNDVASKRITAFALEATEGQRFGWSVTIRDTMPTDKLAIAVARSLRDTTKSQSEQFPAIDTADGEIPLFAADSIDKRKPRESTLLLLQFVDKHLPSTGRHVGRSGPGTRITWQEAYEEFNGRYPGMYSTRKSFEDSYHNAKSAQKGR